MIRDPSSAFAGSMSPKVKLIWSLAALFLLVGGLAFFAFGGRI